MSRLAKLILLCLTVTALLPHAKAFAQEGMTLGVAPSLVSINVDKRRDTYQYPLSVFNDGSKPIQVNVEFYDFSMTPKGKVSFASKTGGLKSWSAATWLYFPENEFSVQPGEDKNLTLFIKPPPDAEAGTHRALITFATAAGKAKKGEVPIRAGVSTLVLVSVAGKTVVEPHIDFDLPRIIFSNPTIGLNVRNTGNTHFFADGDIAFLDRKNKSIFERRIDVPKQGALVLPKAERSFTVGWEQAPYFGFYTVKANVSITGGKEIAKRQDFIMLRWQLLLAAFFLIILGFIVYRLSTKYKIVSKTEKKEDPS